MNLRNIFFSVSLAVSIASCNDLDVPPLNIIQDEDVFQSESGITAYIASLYYDLPIEDFMFNAQRGFKVFPNYPGLAAYTGEMLMCWDGMVYESMTGSQLSAWQYGTIRNINYFIQEFPKYKEDFPSAQADTWLGEAYFMRAYNYFAMVKRYGGIPIVEVVQNFPEQGIEELKVPRNKECEVYDFIAKDLDMAISLLPEESPESGRVNKYVAYGLMSRAMLYAGSIAQYGKVRLDGLLGIPASEAKMYYEEAWSAAKQLEGKYALYQKSVDKYENYCQLFFDGDSPENIFKKHYQYPEWVHSNDAMTVPFQMRSGAGYGNRFCPTLEFVEMFDDVNGKSDWLDTGSDSEPVRYADRLDIFKNAEPRLRATVIFPGDIFKDEVIDIQAGLYPVYPGEKMTSSDANAMYQNKSIIGKSGIGLWEGTSTGFIQRKYSNPSLSREECGLGLQTNPWIEMRYAEILLNRAEAAFALGKKDDALVCINQIRERAGAKAYTQSQLTLKAIQKERRMELAFENHTYWDLRRWRIADTEIDNRQYSGLFPYYVYDEGKYIFKKESVGPHYVFNTHVYYEMIPADQVAKNNLLVQNPGY